MDEEIFITGATGNTGRTLLRLLFRDNTFKDKKITCLCRPGGRREILDRYPVKIVEGDASKASSMSFSLSERITIIHISSILHTPAIIEGCRPIQRLIVVSSTGVFSKHRNIAGKIADIERRVENSGIPYTILRPTMIYGTPTDRNVSRLIRLINRFPVIPLPGSGKSVFQPVYVEDLASCILSSLKRSESIGKSYNIPGGSAHTLREIVQITAELSGKKILQIPLPLRLADLAVRFHQLLSPHPTLKREQILRLGENKSFDYASAARELKYSPIPFPEGVSRQIKSMGL